jgi:hypothetical protein
MNEIHRLTTDTLAHKIVRIPLLGRYGMQRSACWKSVDLRFVALIQIFVNEYEYKCSYLYIFRSYWRTDMGKTVSKSNDKPSKKSERPDDDDLGVGLTDDERVSREPESTGDGASVALGPADLERLPKPDDKT